jgi:hypothetical protein
MAILILPPREDVNAYLGVPMDMDRVSLVMSRISAAMIEAGLPLGEAGAFISPEGISVDTTLDQATINAAWANFDIANYRTPAERQKTEAEQAARAAVASLRNEANILDSATALTTVQLRQSMARTYRVLATLLEYLDRQGVIGD